MPKPNDARVFITGTPVASFEFINLPSINVIASMHHRKKAIVTAEWRLEARLKAETLLTWENSPIIKRRALAVTRVFLPYEEQADIHNVYVKPLYDGFSDAGLWEDDEWCWVPLTLTVFGGMLDIPPREPKYRKSIMDIYELASVDMPPKGLMRLPRGRRRL